jgi:hypothetical protein
VSEPPTTMRDLWAFLTYVAIFIVAFYVVAGPR